MQPETKFKTKVKARLDAVPKSSFEKIQQLALRGVPDYLGVVNGIFVALELKVPPNKVSKGSLQELKLNQIVTANGYAAEVTPDNLEDVLKDLHRIGESNGNIRFLEEKETFAARWKPRTAINR